ncbi:MAG TPA: type III-A CRISPR-associated protein Csm2 [Saprospiraceae bacterium]|nr:type III-A CRISPR-associated protein Csm2 [Saprospiraceae bacterium]
MEKMKTEWVTGEIPINDEVVQWAERTGRELAEAKLTSSNIRRFFGEMRRIQSDFERHKEDVPLLKAKLAYDVGRKSNERGIRAFYNILSPAIGAVEGQESNFTRFVKIAEAIVAFHKLYTDSRNDN